MNVDFDIFWDILNITVLLGTALLIDAAFQFCAGLIDFYSFSSIEKIINDTSQSVKKETLLNPLSSHWCSKLSKSVVLLTLGVQVVIFNAAHYLSHTISTYLLATFYFGVAVSAFFSSRYKLYISWNNSYSAMIGNNKNNLKMPVSYILGIIFISIFGTCYEIFTNMYVHENTLTVMLVCMLTFIAAFSFETLSLSFLDKVSYEERALSSSGLVMQTYGLMGLVAAIGFWMLSIFKNHMMLSLLIISISIIYISLSVRHPDRNKSLSIHHN